MGRLQCSIACVPYSFSAAHFASFIHTCACLCPPPRPFRCPRHLSPLGEQACSFPGLSGICTYPPQLFCCSFCFTHTSSCHFPMLSLVLGVSCPSLFFWLYFRCTHSLSVLHSSGALARALILEYGDECVPVGYACAGFIAFLRACPT